MHDNWSVGKGKNKVIMEFIEGFYMFSEEINNLSDSNARIEIVEDIYNCILKDDVNYATERLDKERLYGLFYVNKKNELILYIKQTGIINEIGTIFHELVHLSDFIKLGKLIGNEDYRQLQNNMFFILWSEFHADYISYRYLIEIGKNDIKPEQVSQKIKQDLCTYYNSSPQLELQKTINTTVRSYGRYMALQSHFPEELDKYLKGFFFNQDFLNLYNFLWEHRSFESIKDCLDEVVQIFKNIEK